MSSLDSSQALRPLKKTYTMSIKNVLIAGASANLGPLIIDNLIAAKSFNVSILTRPSSSTAFPPSVTVYKTDYSPASLNTILGAFKPDAVISNLNVVSPDIAQLQIALINAAKANGVRRFVPSEFGLDTSNPDVQRLAPAVGTKTTAVEHLKSLQSDDFTWTALITGLFFDWGIQTKFLSINPEEKKILRWDDGSAAFSTTNISTIAKAIVSLLSDSTKLAATANKYIYIASHTITNNEYIKAVQKATPAEKWTIEQVDSEEVLKKAPEEIKAGNHAARYKLIQAITFGKRRLSEIEETKLSNKLLGLEKEDLLADLKRVLAPASRV